jgi:cytochrome c556
MFVAGTGVAAGLTGADAAKARQEHMKGLGAASKAVKEQLSGGAPDLSVIKVQAAKLDDGAKALTTWFPAGSGQSADPKSEALPVVWSDWSGFQTKAKAFADAAAKFDAVAQSGNSAGVGPAFHDVSAACKGCHETYKAKDKG